MDSLVKRTDRLSFSFAMDPLISRCLLFSQEGVWGAKATVYLFQNSWSLTQSTDHELIALARHAKLRGPMIAGVKERDRCFSSPCLIQYVLEALDSTLCILYLFYVVLCGFPLSEVGLLSGM